MFMRMLLACCFAAGLPSAAQTAPTSAPELPKDPRALLELARQHYDFNDPVLKPCHLKATVQLYDSSGKPNRTAAFEYWWASPKVYRVSLIEGDSGYSEWHAADGKISFLLNTNHPLLRQEYELAHLAPSFTSLADTKAYETEKNDFELKDRTFGKSTLACVTISKQIKEVSGVPVPPILLVQGGYCFDKRIPALRMEMCGSTVVQFDDLVGTQGHYLAQQVDTYVDEQHMLGLHIDSISRIESADSALTPPPDAHLFQPTGAQQHSGLSGGKLVKQQLEGMISKQAREGHWYGDVLEHLSTRCTL